MYQWLGKDELRIACIIFCFIKASNAYLPLLAQRSGQHNLIHKSRTNTYQIYHQALPPCLLMSTTATQSMVIYIPK